MITNKGKELEKYVHKTLLSKEPDKTPARAIEYNANLYKEVVDLMREKGVMIGYESTRRHDGYRDRNSTRSEFFHVDGVGVGVLRVRYVDCGDHELNNVTQIRLASESSDSLDNVVEMVLDKFSHASFEETEDHIPKNSFPLK